LTALRAAGSSLVRDDRVFSDSNFKQRRNTPHWSRAWKARLIVANNPDWDNLFEAISNKDVDGRDKPGHDEISSATDSNFKQPQGHDFAFSRHKMRPSLAKTASLQSIEGAGNAGCSAAPAALCASEKSTQA
jgi:hypothetical protein